MKPVHQTKFGGEAAPKEDWGNCMQAALASALELPLEAVPNNVAADDWWDRQNAFLGTLGLRLEAIDPSSILPQGVHLMQGPGPRGIPHVVVGRDGEMIHDPHPSGGGLSEVQALWCFICLDPAPHAKNGSADSRTEVNERREGSE